MKTYIVGTRESKLAQTQTKKTLELIKRSNPDFNYKLKIIKTAGDYDKKTFLKNIDDKDFFTGSIEKALLDKTIDLAIHSMKDLPGKNKEGLVLATIPKREDPRDVLVLRKEYDSITNLPENAMIATSSLRRKTLLKELRPDLSVVSMRGNVDERINQMHREKLDGILLAAAGVKRLGMEEHISFYLDESNFIPAPAQGILAIQTRQEDSDLIQKIKTIGDESATIQYRAERTFYALAEDKYSIIGAVCLVKDSTFDLYGLLGNSTVHCKEMLSAKIGQEKLAATKLFKLLKEQVSSHE